MFRDFYTPWDDAIAWQRQQELSDKQKELLKELETLLTKSRKFGDTSERQTRRGEIAAELGIAFQEKLYSCR